MKRVWYWAGLGMMWCGLLSAQDKVPEPFAFNSERLENRYPEKPKTEVEVVLHPEEKFDPGRTVMWTPLFQSFWESFALSRLGGFDRAEPPNPLMTKLNTFQWKPYWVMPPEQWKVWSGPPTHEFLKGVNAEAELMCGSKDLFQLRHGRRRADIAVYALLNRKLEFQRPFNRLDFMNMKFTAQDQSKSLVASFGYAGRGGGSEVRVLAYRPEENCYALQASTKQGDETVVLYRPAKLQDFATACSFVREWRNQFDPAKGRMDDWSDRVLHRRDRVFVPCLRFNADRDITQRFSGQIYFKNAAVPQKIIEAHQKCAFELNENGASVQIEAQMYSVGGYPTGKPADREFLYNGPFFVFLWRDTAEWPYFGVWVGDHTALMDPKD